MDEQTLRWQQNGAALAGAQLKQQRQQQQQARLSDLQQQQRQHYHDNNNNSNGNNNSKVRLLITPATESYGSSRQQLDRSATIITTATLTTAEQQQQHQQRSQQSSNRQKNYHHYDYYTDSDLTSSLLPTTPTTLANNNNYDQNILLFATEHSNSASGHGQRSGHFQGSQQQPARAERLRSGGHHLAYSQQRLGSPYGHSGSGAQQHQQATGKFINLYPSWRQAHSPTTSHYQNYSFHVPLHLQHPHHHHYHHQQQARRQQPARPQSRYGYLAPGDRAKLSRSSFKSRTLAHIPHSVRSEEQQQQQAEVGAREDEEEEEEINYYDRPSLSTRQFMLSEGDLLKVRSVVLEDGPENPFKPGTELSWEAEMMVRLMKRGYPIQELPALVETAKQVAASGNAKDVADEQVESQQQQQRQSRSRSLSRRPQRRQSSHDLSQVKQVWASSLSRARSMPRFGLGANTGAADKTDADSMDQLIASIENEIDHQELGGERTATVADGDDEPTSGALDKSAAAAKSAALGRAGAAGRQQRKPSLAGNSKSSGATAAAATGKKTKQRTTSEQQVAATRRDGGGGRKSAPKSLGATNKPKHNQIVGRGNKSTTTTTTTKQADLKASKQIKKRNMDCCTIQ